MVALAAGTAQFAYNTNMTPHDLPFTLRPLDPALDFPPLVELLRYTAGGVLVTVEQLFDWHRSAPPDRVREQTVALDASGALVGYGDAGRDTWMRPGRFWASVVVAPEARSRGLGARLYGGIDAFARAHGATELDGEVPENSAAGARFAERCGFTVRRHIFESVLDLATFDETPHRAALEAAEASGIRFLTLADEGNTLAAQRKLWALNRDTGHDVPGREDEPFQPFEDFQRSVFGATWFRADGQILAADGDAYVGLAAIGYFPERQMAYNMHTGVARAYRGRKLAQALKLLAARRARAYGATTLRTNNDAHNTPMLAVNRKFGYRPEPGYFVVRQAR
jgi:GNAT superfamily N-acetyltransferase